MGGDTLMHTVVDAAGGGHGGAARFLAELEMYSRDAARSDVTIVGRDQRLSPAWMVKREVKARGSHHRIALNNASFLVGPQKTVLLRNALHFATAEELDLLGYRPSRELRAQIPIVRRLAQRADTLVVPCSAMGHRVAMILPDVESRIVTRAHPVTVPSMGEPTGQGILMPVINSAYKHLDRHLKKLIEALEQANIENVMVRVTDVPSSYPAELRDHPKIQFLGILDHATLWEQWGQSRTIYYPTGLESFGYPLAEARATGRAALSLDTPQNREIAGPAHCGFTEGNLDSLSAAVKLASERSIVAEPLAFDRTSYFDWLFDIGQAQNV